MSDSYPEHLNPFAEDIKAKSKNSLKNSFREFKRTLRQSFRIKRKEDEAVVIRQKNDLPQPRYTSYPNHQPAALPRSRFQERLSKQEPTNTLVSSNPFEEDTDRGTTLRRRGKKRAPLPPKSVSSQNVNEEKLSPGDSHWSLTSVETDYSTENITEENGNECNSELVEQLVDFNKNMEKLKDDTNNNNVITKDVEKVESNNNVPDLVVSCPEANKNDVEKDSCREETKNEESEETKNINSCSEEVRKEEEINICCEEATKEEGEGPKETNNKENKEKDESDTSKEYSKISSKEDCKSDTNIEEKESLENSDNSTEPYLYNERKSLFIAGSKDKLNEDPTYTGRVSLFITGSCDDLDDTSEETNDVPIPKQRKNKLSKSALLGV